MGPFRNGGTFLAFLSFVLAILSDVTPNPTNLNIGSSSGGYGGGGLSLDKMIFTVQDARKLVANKMKGFGGGSSKKPPPPKKQKPKGYQSSEKGGGYASDPHGYSSEIKYHTADPYGHSGAHKRELPFKSKPEVETSEKKETGWTPVVKSRQGFSRKKGAPFIYKKAKGGQIYSATTSPSSILSVADKHKKVENKQVTKKYYETRPNGPSKIYRIAQQHRA